MAEGRQNEPLSWISPLPRDHKATTSLQLLGSFAGIPESPVRESFELGTMLPVLSSCVAFQGEFPTEGALELRAKDLQEKVLSLPPLNLPTAIMMDLSYLDTLDFRAFKIEVQLSVPSLAGHVRGTDIFVCWLSGFAPSLSFLIYARSPEGRARLLQPQLEYLRGKIDTGRLAISLLIVHWYFHLTGTGLCNGADTSTDEDSLITFHSLIHGEAALNAQWVLKKQLRALEHVLWRQEDVFPGLSGFVRKYGTWGDMMEDDVSPVLAQFWELTLQDQTARVAFHKVLIHSVPLSSRLAI
ncbi:hypothetical protein PG994_003374 [Apiospora phragmitis]|uniref:Uncharacterized protein n=1 Tax=Apiospora phragmitis TaxID=2905665 RepID=A0ABR1VZ71_9PEZI